MRSSFRNVINRPSTERLSAEVGSEECSTKTIEKPRETGGNRLLGPYGIVVACLAGWVNRHQQQVIEYLQEEVRVGGMLRYYHRRAA